MYERRDDGQEKRENQTEGVDDRVCDIINDCQGSRQVGHCEAEECMLVGDASRGTVYPDISRADGCSSEHGRVDSETEGTISTISEVRVHPLPPVIDHFGPYEL